MENTNNENEVVETPAVAPAVEVAAPASEPVLEASVESVASETVEPQAEVRASELPAAETVSTEPLVASVDPRAEFKAFVAKFGSASAAEYFAAGLTMPEATEKHLTLQSSKIKSLEARLASADRGLPAAVELTASETDISEKPAGLKDLIQLGTKK